MKGGEKMSIKDAEAEFIGGFADYTIDHPEENFEKLWEGFTKTNPPPAGKEKRLRDSCKIIVRLRESADGYIEKSTPI